jgi:ArsR family transcriptional regulator, arsenate/arsenite/antimonite-responsive transcriptional repressor
MTDPEAAIALAALGHEARLGVFRLLVRAGPEGLAVGDIGRLTGLPASTLAHHLATLVQAGLVIQESAGRRTINRASFERMHAVLGHVAEACCTGVRLVPEDAL